MLNVDENELIEFFGVLPTTQDPEEQEFFGTTIFDIYREDLHLSISYSSHYANMTLYLYAGQSKEAAIEISLENVHDIKVKRDKPTSPPVLWINGEVGSNSCNASGFKQTIQVTVTPGIRIKFKNEQ